MAEGKLLLEIVTPYRRLVSAEVDEVTAPGFHGEFGALPRHTPYLCQLAIGVLSYRAGSARYFLSIMGGYAEVGPERVTLLTEVAERAEELMAGRAQESVDFERAAAALRRALARLDVARQSGVS